MDRAGEQGAGGGVEVAFLDDGAEAPQVLRVEPALAQAVARAERVNDGRDALALSFDSLFIGLLATPDATGAWLHRQFDASGPALAALLRRRGWTARELDALQAEAVALPAAPLRRTASAREALDDARQRAAGAGRLPGTADALAALLMRPRFHDSDFRAMGIDRAAWAAAFAQAGLPPAAPPGVPDAPDAPALDLGPAGLEAHVADALRAALALAGDGPVGPAEVLRAVRGMPSAASPAFQRFARLVPAGELPPLPASDVLPDEARLEPSLRTQLLRAQRPAAGSTRPVQVWGRDLVTAALLCPDALVQPALPEGVALDLVRDGWYGYVTSASSHRSRGGWAAWWRDAGVPLPQPRRAGYAVESDDGEDQLGIAPEAHAFARLILDKAVQPPLSIGILGDWGSGKSFFIEQIRKGIQSMVGEGRPELHARIVQIEFNAWHASDSNLWASLVTNIFDEIWHKVSPAGDERDGAAARARLEAQIKQARGAVHEAEAQVEIGRQALAQAEQDLKDKRALLAWNRYVRDWSTDRLRRIAQDAGWHEPIETINDVDRTVRALQASGLRLRTLATALLDKPLLHLALPAAAALGAAVVAGVLVGFSALDAWEQRVTQALTALAGVAGAVAVPLKLARSKVERLTQTLGGIQSGFDRALEAVRQQDGARAEQVEQARRELESAKESVQVARSRLAELMNRQVALDPANRLSSFLQERVQSTQYRAQQGIISLVHKDFSELSRYMKDLRDAAAARGAAPEGPGAIEPIDRIVLYVDDLDRCRPAHVVNMLEAVHLLLALDLFVVVVAVDSRWLTRALEVYYHELLASDAGSERDGLRESTPQNYLEKIFQITYALAPMQPARFADYVGFLAGDGAGPGAPPPAPAAAGPSGAPAPGGAAAAAPSPAAPAAAGGAAAPAPAGAPAPPAARPSSRPVQIGEAERALIVALVPLLPTPRIAKRLLNVYRVIKAAKTADELEAFERDERAPACLLMLALLFGRPQVAGPLLRGLHERTPPFDRPAEPLLQALRRRVPAADEAPQAALAWQRTVETLAAIGLDLTVARCARETGEVARYSLISGRDWHTWRTPADPPGDGPPAPPTARAA